MLNALCGSTEKVEHILSWFEQKATLGMLGPAGKVRAYNTQATKPQYGFRAGEVEAMKATWPLVYPNGDSLPDPADYRICAGSFYWSRYKPLVSQIYTAIPRLVRAMPEGYPEECRQQGPSPVGRCGHMYALE